MTASVGWDIGKPGGDNTAVSLRCQCGRMTVITWPAEVECKIVALNCPCGRTTKFPDQPGED